MPLGPTPSTPCPTAVTLGKSRPACDIESTPHSSASATEPADFVAPPRKAAVDYPEYIKSFQAEAAALFNSGVAAGVAHLQPFYELAKQETSIATERTNRAYRERNELAVALVKFALLLGLPAGRGRDDKATDPDWGHTLYVVLPYGEQVSWHMAPDAIPLLEGIPEFDSPWDGTYLGRDGGWSKLIWPHAEFTPGPADIMGHLRQRVGFLTLEMHKLAQERDMLNSKCQTLESLRPHWAKGYSSDSIAAQCQTAALNQIWEHLGVADQTACMEKLHQLMPEGTKDV